MRELTETPRDLKIEPPKIIETSPQPNNASSVNADALAVEDARALAIVRAKLQEQKQLKATRASDLPLTQDSSLQNTNNIRETTTTIATLREKVKTVAEPIVTRAKSIGQRCKESLHTSQEWGDRLSQYFETQVTNLQKGMNDRSLEWQRQIYQVAIPTQEAISQFLHSGAFEISMKFLENALTIQKLLPRLQALPIGGI